MEEFLERGPGFICLFHPALGPLWDIVAQKLQGGMLAPRAELVLEVAEAHISNLRVDGSLRIRADAVMGRVENALAVNCSQVSIPLKTRRNVCLQYCWLGTLSSRMWLGGWLCGCGVPLGSLHHLYIAIALVRQVCTSAKISNSMRRCYSRDSVLKKAKSLGN